MKKLMSLSSFVIVLSLFAACKKDEAAEAQSQYQGQPAPAQTYAQQPAQYPQQQAQYPQQPAQYPQQQAQYPQQPAQYPQQQAQYPQQAPTYTAPPAAPPAAPASGLATPGVGALSCQTDAQCLLGKCNTQYGKCAFPCVSDNDCQAGNYCFKGSPAAACLPKLGGQ